MQWQTAGCTAGKIVQGRVKQIKLIYLHGLDLVSAGVSCVKIWGKLPAPDKYVGLESPEWTCGWAPLHKQHPL